MQWSDGFGTVTLPSYENEYTVLGMFLQFIFVTNYKVF
jgi:hypothetical protein